MVACILVFVVFSFVLYTSLSTNGNSRFTATASAIRQIWSGSCRLSCRHSQCSTLSGLSGLAQGHHTIDEDSVPGPSNDCICESCPCALIEDFLRKCSPATNVYSQIIEILANYYENVVNTVTYLYMYLNRVVECRTSCQRQAQFIESSSYDTNDNTDVKKHEHEHGEQDTDNKRNQLYSDPQPETSKRKSTAYERLQNKLKRKNSNILEFDKKSKNIDVPNKTDNKICKQENNNDDVDNEKEFDNKKTPLEQKLVISDDTLQTTDDSINTLNSCPKCVEKGRVCIPNCPKARNSKKR
ncbi:uncharacterized protein LOC131848661 [Achroia grisella]|uniref:uncharacterized protein LOC131848661 n=1 Tax=Achroia grisella TaxID=688607 RepID=UPI0027D23E60|nr:uncharacterized protein LOC131848661 [Achroia grisella]